MLAEAAKFIDDWQAAQKARLHSGVEEDSYVYLHLNADDGQPHHVGIGHTVGRPWGMRSNRNRKHRNKVAKHGVRVEIISEDLTDAQAKWWEVRWIKALRAAGYDLTNLTDGGDGLKGYTHTPESCDKMSVSQKKRAAKPDYKPPMAYPGAKEKYREYLDTPETKKARSLRMLGPSNPMSTLSGKENYIQATSSEEYKSKRLENAPRGDTHYMAKDPIKGVIAGKRLQQSFTDELRSEYGKKGWETRRRNLEKAGKTLASVMTERQINANIDNGKRLQNNLTKEKRVENALKGWGKRYKRYQYWGA